MVASGSGVPPVEPEDALGARDQRRSIRGSCVDAVSRYGQSRHNASQQRKQSSLIRRYLWCTMVRLPKEAQGQHRSLRASAVESAVSGNGHARHHAIDSGATNRP